MTLKELNFILEYVKRTNPEITEEKLRKILKNSNKYLISSLIIISKQ